LWKFFTQFLNTESTAEPKGDAVLLISNDSIQEFSQSINKDPGHSCVEMKLLLLKHGEMYFTTEAFKQQVCVFVCMYLGVVNWVTTADW